MTPFQKEYLELSNISNAVSTVEMEGVHYKVFERGTGDGLDKPFTGLLEAKDGGVLRIDNQASIEDAVFRLRTMFGSGRVHPKDYV